MKLRGNLFNRDKPLFILLLLIFSIVVLDPIYFAWHFEQANLYSYVSILLIIAFYVGGLFFIVSHFVKQFGSEVNIFIKRINERFNFIDKSLNSTVKTVRLMTWQNSESVVARRAAISTYAENIKRYVGDGNIDMKMIYNLSPSSMAVLLINGEKGSEVLKHSISVDKEYYLIRGCIDVKFENDSDEVINKSVQQDETLYIKADAPHSIKFREDSLILVQIK